MFRPAAHLQKERFLLRVRFAEERRGSLKCIIRRIIQGSIVVALFFKLLDFAAQDTRAWPLCHAGMPFRVFQRVFMLCQGQIEGFGRREEAFLKQFDDKLGRVVFNRVGSLLEPPLAVLL